MIQKMKKIHTIFAAGVVGVVSALVALFGIAKNNNERVLTDFSDSDLKFFLSLNDGSSKVYADSASVPIPGPDDGGGSGANGDA